jgi:hypothetical protein
MNTAMETVSEQPQTASQRYAVGDLVKFGQKFGQVYQLTPGGTHVIVEYHNGMKLTTTLVSVARLSILTRDEFASRVKKSGQTIWYDKF